MTFLSCCCPGQHKHSCSSTSTDVTVSGVSQPTHYCPAGVPGSSPWLRSTQHLPFSGGLKTKCCLLGFWVSEQLAGPELPHLVAIQGFLPGWLGLSSLVFFLKVDSLGNTDLHMCPHSGILGNTES